MVGETKASCPQELAVDQPVDWVTQGHGRLVCWGLVGPGHGCRVKGSPKIFSMLFLCGGFPKPQKSPAWVSHWL